MINFEDIAADIELNGILHGQISIGEFHESAFEAFDLSDNKCRTELKCNDYVYINNMRHGYLRSCGKVHFALGLYGGVELVEAEGSHDGQFEGVRLEIESFCCYVLMS